jgi:hypothetical protein
MTGSRYRFLLVLLAALFSTAICVVAHAEPLAANGCQPAQVSSGGAVMPALEVAAVPARHVAPTVPTLLAWAVVPESPVVAQCVAVAELRAPRAPPA